MFGRRPWSMNQWCLTMWTIPIAIVQSRLQNVHHRVPRVIRMQKRWHAVSLWIPSCTGRDGLMLGIRPIIKGSESIALAVSNSKSGPLLFSSLPHNQTNLVTRRHTIEDDAGTVEAFRLTPLKSEVKWSESEENRTNLVTRHSKDDADTVKAFRLTPLKRLSSLPEWVVTRESWSHQLELYISADVVNLYATVGNFR